jgi:hypothetical protein
LLLDEVDPEQLAMAINKTTHYKFKLEFDFANLFG